MMALRSANGLTSETNRLIGKTVHFLVFITIITISYKTWGIKMIEEFVFYIVSILSFALTKFILLITGVWKY